MTRATYLTRLRLAAGHTQTEAARLVHLDGRGADRTWRRWEQGERPVPEAIVHLYALLTGQAYRDAA